jgi:hypothetical protein
MSMYIIYNWGSNLLRLINLQMITRLLGHALGSSSSGFFELALSGANLESPGE